MVKIYMGQSIGVSNAVELMLVVFTWYDIVEKGYEITWEWKNCSLMVLQGG